jgi:hypothetical protein
MEAPLSNGAPAHAHECRRQDDWLEEANRRVRGRCAAFQKFAAGRPAFSQKGGGGLSEDETLLA